MIFTIVLIKNRRTVSLKARLEEHLILSVTSKKYIRKAESSIKAGSISSTNYVTIENAKKCLSAMPPLSKYATTMF